MWVIPSLGILEGRTNILLLREQSSNSLVWPLRPPAATFPNSCVTASCHTVLRPKWPSNHPFKLTCVFLGLDLQSQHRLGLCEPALPCSQLSFQAQVKDKLVTLLRVCLALICIIPYYPAHPQPQGGKTSPGKACISPGTRTEPDRHQVLIKYLLNDCRVYLIFYHLQLLRTIENCISQVRSMTWSGIC